MNTRQLNNLDEEIRKMGIMNSEHSDRFDELSEYGGLNEHEDFINTLEEDIRNMVDDRFNLSMSKGFIKAYIPDATTDNFIYVSCNFLDDLKNNLELYEDEINDFWKEIADYDCGKKIGFIGGLKSSYPFYDFEDSSISSLFLNESSSLFKFDAHVIFLAMLDLNKTYKYFTKASLETINFKFVKKDGSIHNNSLEDLADYFSSIYIYNDVPKGFKDYLKKQEIVNHNLSVPENKMSMLIWEKKINSIKITQKIWEQIGFSLSKTYRVEQWSILESLLKGKKWFDKKNIHNIWL